MARSRAMDAFSVRRAADERPDGEALRLPNGSLSFAQLAERVEARLLDEHAPKAGRAHRLEASCQEAALVDLYAALEAGAPLVLMPPGLASAERVRLEARIDALMADPTARLPSDAAAVVFTSGTTGLPKPAVLTHRALEASVRAFARNVPLGADDVWQLLLSPARVGGLSVLTRSLAARSAVAAGERFCAAQFWSRAERGGITLTSMVPAMLAQAMDASPEHPAPGRLRAVLLGGAAAAPSLLARARRRGIPVIATYGMTETASNVAATPFAERFDVAGVGRPHPGVQIRIIDGRIQVRGDVRMAGYWGEPAMAPETWLDTGDLGRFDAQGRLHVEGRRSDRIQSGGMNVMPAEVEHALAEVEGVRSAMVFGIPDPTWGEIVAALLVAEDKPLADEDLVRGIQPLLAGYKSPRRIAWVEQLPETPSGKPDRSGRASQGLAFRTLHYSAC